MTVPNLSIVGHREPPMAKPAMGVVSQQSGVSPWWARLEFPALTGARMGW